MSAPRLLSLIARAKPGFFPDPGTLEAWQANDLTVRLTLPDNGVTLMEGVTHLVLEIQSTKRPAGTAPLAASTISVGTDLTSWDFDLTTEDMSFSIGSVDSLACYLFITARDAGGTILQTLAAAPLTVKAGTYSGIAAPAPTGSTSLFLRLESATPDGDEKYTVFFGTKTGKIVIENVTEV